jgi:hypothetical protein
MRCPGRAGPAGHAVDQARADPAGHCARPGHRYGDRRILAAALPLTGSAGRGRRADLRRGRVADGGEPSDEAAAGTGSQRGGARPAPTPAGAASGVGARRAGPLAGLARQALIALPAGTPSLRLLADHAAEALAGISQALDGLALLVDDPARLLVRRRRVRFHVADWLPSLVNAGRAFVVICARRAVLDRHRLAQRCRCHYFRGNRHRPVCATSRDAAGAGQCAEPGD